MAKSSFLVLTAKHCTVTTASIDNDTGTTTKQGTKTGQLDARGPRRGPTQSKARACLVRKMDLDYKHFNC